MSESVGHLRTRLYLDLETIPDQRPGAEERAAARVQAPGNYKDPDKIAAYVAERGEEAWLKTALDGRYGQLVVVSWAIDDEPAQSVMMLDERKLLTQLWRALGKRIGNNPLFVGHCIADFDLPFLYQRSLINNIYPTLSISAAISPYSPDVFDTSYRFMGDRNKRISLQELAELLGVPHAKDEEHNGSQVWELVKAGRLAEVEAYCRGDVDTVREIHKRMHAFTLAMGDDESLPF